MVFQIVTEIWLGVSHSVLRLVRPEGKVEPLSVALGTLCVAVHEELVPLDLHPTI